ncbi:MAG: hypothetical protein DRZ82_08335 [Thermoprotei archaeon]|nr:MAG: hypothetical protein DRZ82_08335 [Thermoprotei archaeon]
MTRWLKLLKIIGSPFVESTESIRTSFSHDLYRIALTNKIPLSYLSHVQGKKARSLYRYHARRLEVLMNVLCDVCKTLEEHSLSYIVFKTLRPFREEVADIDALIPDGDDFEDAISILSSRGYVIMERGLYCTTLMDPRYRFTTEIMIDIYKEVSAGPLIYLDKNLLLGCIEYLNVNGYGVRVFKPEAELLTLMAHSLLKEGKITLADYLSTLHYLCQMDNHAIDRFIGLAKRMRTTYGVRYFLTLVAYLHKVAHGFIPDKVIEVLRPLGGPISVSGSLLYRELPYCYDDRVLVKVYLEKLGDPLFRRSLAMTFRWASSRKSIARLVNRFVMMER